MLKSYKKHIAHQCSIALVAALMLPLAWAGEVEKRYPNLSTGVKYQFEYWGDLDKRLRDKSSELDAPEKAIDLIMKYYGVPKELREKLFARVLLSFDQNYLIQIGIWGANDATKYPQEFSTHKAMVQKNCEAVRQHFDSYCGTTHDLSRSQPQVIVNVKDQKVVPVPAIDSTHILYV